MSERDCSEVAGFAATHVIDTNLALKDLPQRQTILAYVLGNRADLGDNLNRLLGIPDHALLAADLLALLREQLTHILPLTFKRNGGEHYGRPQDGNAPYAIPYLRSQPVETSQCGHHYEALNYTIQTYLRAMQPLIWQEIRGVLQDLQNRGSAEVLQDNCRWMDTEVERVFAKLLEGTPLTGCSITQLLHDDDSMKHLAQFTQKDVLMLFFYLQNFVLTRIEVFPLQISSNARHFKNSFARMQGFTGTPWDHTTYPKSLGKELSDQTDGVTANALFNDKKTNVLVIPDSSVKGILDAALATVLGAKHAHSLIDTGAIFKGVKNIVVAKELHEY